MYFPNLRLHTTVLSPRLHAKIGQGGFKVVTNKRTVIHRAVAGENVFRLLPELVPLFVVEDHADESSRQTRRHCQLGWGEPGRAVQFGGFGIGVAGFDGASRLSHFSGVSGATAPAFATAVHACLSAHCKFVEVVIVAVWLWGLFAD